MSLEILPSIDLRGGKVVRLKQGDYAQQLNYDVDPIATAMSFRDAGASWIHVVDLDGAKEGRPAQTDLIARIIAATALHVEAGGGVRSTDDVAKLLEAGAARVVVGTKAIEDWAWFESLALDPRFARKLVLALDAKNGIVATRGWTETSGQRAVDIAAKISDWPVAAILYTDVARDGMLKGPNIEQTRKLAEAGRVPVIASGGVGTIEHVRQARQNSPPIWGCIIGRSLYEGTVDLSEAIQIARASI
jgi:phosphoribosylformimino-5-aminoimidazole carboxamide ribotide isomerase